MCVSFVDDQQQPLEKLNRVTDSEDLTSLVEVVTVRSPLSSYLLFLRLTISPTLVQEEDSEDQEIEKIVTLIDLNELKFLFLPHLLTLLSLVT